MVAECERRQGRPTGMSLREVVVAGALGAVLLASGWARAQPLPPPAQPYPPLPPPPQSSPPQPYPPPQAAPAPTPYPAPSKDEDAEKPGWNLDAESFGLRGTTLGTTGSDRDARTYGLGLAGLGLANLQDRVFTARADALWHLGGGSGGFEGQFGGSVAVGGAWLVDGAHGPFVRVGVQGYLLGNDSFFQSTILFPQGQLGWHIGSRDGFLLEIGGNVAPMLDGRFDVGDEGRRRLGSSSAYGLYGDLFVGPLSGTIGWRHEKAVSLPGTSVNELAGHMCLATGREKKKNGFALCFDGRYTTGDVAYGDPLRTSTANAAYFGITLGIGTTTSKGKD